MKQLWCTVVIALALGCGGDPLKADVDTFCNAAEATGGSSFIELGTGATTLEMIAASPPAKATYGT